MKKTKKLFHSRRYEKRVKICKPEKLTLVIGHVYDVTFSNKEHDGLYVLLDFSEEGNNVLLGKNGGYMSMHESWINSMTYHKI